MDTYTSLLKNIYQVFITGKTANVISATPELINSRFSALVVKYISEHGSHQEIRTGES